MAAARRPDRDPTRPVYVISVAATLVSAHPRTLRIYEDEGLVCPARTPTNIRLYSEEDIRRILRREFGVARSLQAVYDLLHRLGFEPLRPRPRHPEADPAAQDRFKKASPAGSPRSPRPAPGSGSRSGSRTRPGSGRRGR